MLCWLACSVHIPIQWHISLEVFQIQIDIHKIYWADWFLTNGMAFMCVILYNVRCSIWSNTIPQDANHWNVIIHFQFEYVWRTQIENETLLFGEIFVSFFFIQNIIQRRLVVSVWILTSSIVTNMTVASSLWSFTFTRFWLNIGTELKTL